MNCTQCGSALAINTPACSHCGAINALDLLAVGEYRASAHVSSLHCPNGCGFLRAYALGRERIGVQHCEQCKGMLLGDSLLEDVLRDIHQQVNEKSPERLAQLAAQRVARYQPINRPCPVCANTMQSYLFRPDFPLQLEHCEHGVWLDNGELSILAEWSESGGMIQTALPLTSQQKEDLAKAELQAKKTEGNILFAFGFFGALVSGAITSVAGRDLRGQTPELASYITVLSAPFWLTPLAIMMHKGMNMNIKSGQSDYKISTFGTGFWLLFAQGWAWGGVVDENPALAMNVLPWMFCYAFLASYLLSKWYKPGKRKSAFLSGSRN